jgi:hypothetical protein
MGRSDGDDGSLVTQLRGRPRILERADYPSGEDAMMWGEYGFAPRFPGPRPTDPPPIGKLIERFERLRAEQ